MKKQYNVIKNKVTSQARIALGLGLIAVLSLFTMEALGQHIPYIANYTARCLCGALAGQGCFYDLSTQPTECDCGGTCCTPGNTAVAVTITTYTGGICSPAPFNGCDYPPGSHPGSTTRADTKLLKVVGDCGNGG